jgi:SAM-dependent methyltransferase
MIRSGIEQALRFGAKLLPLSARRRLRDLWERAWPPPTPLPPERDYATRAAEEAAIFSGMAEVHDLPPIFHYWSNTHLRPELERFGFSNPDEFFAKYLAETAARAGDRTARFVSIGSGNCDTEVRVAGLLRERGVRSFTLECLDLNPEMLERGRALAQAAGVSGHFVAVPGDFNGWRAQAPYDAVMANQSLHHVTALEHLFDSVRDGLVEGGAFIVSDMIGRNGHLLWPEARTLVDEYWRLLPESHRWNVQLKRKEQRFEDWDCSNEGFEGVRAQDILPLLRLRFGFELFLPFANIIDPFIGRSFGPHFVPAREGDRRLVDRIHARDEAEMRGGAIRPTHLLAVMRRDMAQVPAHRPFLAPADCERPTARPLLPPDPAARVCPACHATSRVDRIGHVPMTQAGSFHTDTFALAHCRRCDTVRLDPTPTEADLRAMYVDAVQFSDDTYSSEERVDALLRYYGGCLDNLKLLPPAGGASLEVGAGRAWVSRAIKSRRAKVHTVAQDVTAECSTQCPWVDRYVVGTIAEVGLEQAFHLISLTHVIEHLVDPLAMLHDLAGRLAPGGRIFVTAPYRPIGWQPGDGIAKWREYSYLHVPAHITYLSRAWFDLAGESAGLVVSRWDAGHEDGQAFEVVLERAAE